MHNHAQHKNYASMCPYCAALGDGLTKSTSRRSRFNNLKKEPPRTAVAKILCMSAPYTQSSVNSIGSPTPQTLTPNPTARPASARAARALGLQSSEPLAQDEAALKEESSRLACMLALPVEGCCGFRWVWAEGPEHIRCNSIPLQFLCTYSRMGTNAFFKVFKPL